MRHCQVCGKEFEPSRAGHSLCSQTCRMKRWQDAHPRQRVVYQSQCVACGKAIESEKPGRRFCSTQCRWTYRNQMRPTTQDLDRKCSVCGTTFQPHQVRGVGKQCCSEACRLERRKLLKQKRYEKLSDGSDDGKRRIRKGDQLKIYGISLSRYDEMLAAQNGLCAICGKAETSHSSRGGVKMLSVDHCHKKGHVRKLLCSSCNWGLGNFRDDPALLRAAADYLEH